AAFGLRALRSAESVAKSAFVEEKARGLFAGIAAHGMLPLDQRPTAAFALVLGAMAHVAGWVIPPGVPHRLTRAQGASLARRGGVPGEPRRRGRAWSPRSVTGRIAKDSRRSMRSLATTVFGHRGTSAPGVVPATLGEVPVRNGRVQGRLGSLGAHTLACRR